MKTITRILSLLLLLTLLYFIVLWRAQPPAARDVDTPLNEFSAQRAFDVLSELLAEGVPHPVDTEANRRVRQRITDHLSALDYDVQLQSEEGCSWDGSCVIVENISTTRPGITDGPAIMLSAHYDSVEWGPGAADNGAAVVALLEIAQILRDEPLFQNPLYFLFTDGEEEPSLVGAEVFVGKNALAQNVGVVINLEARGTSGASIMFETSDENGWLVEQFAQSAAPRKTASSLFFEIYKILPNDTDLTVFKEAGMAGYGFAFIDSVENYHTPNDNLQNLDRGSLQHHGENALALVRQLANADLSQAKAENVIYSDILSFFVVRYPLWLGQLLAVLLLGMVVVLAYFSQKRGRISWGGLVLGMLGMVGALLLPMLLLLVPQELWQSIPLPRICIVLITGFIALGIARLLSLRYGALDVSIAAWLVWSILTIVLVFLLPGASVIFFLPAVCAVILHAFGAWRAAWLQPVLWISLVGAAIIWLKLLPLFDIALTVEVGPAIIAVPLAVLATVVLPLLVVDREAKEKRI